MPARMVRNAACRAMGGQGIPVRPARRLRQRGHAAGERGSFAPIPPQAGLWRQPSRVPARRQDPAARRASEPPVASMAPAQSIQTSGSAITPAWCARLLRGPGGQLPPVSRETTAGRRSSGRCMRRHVDKSIRPPCGFSTAASLVSSPGSRLASAPKQERLPGVAGLRPEDASGDTGIEPGTGRHWRFTCAMIAPRFAGLRPCQNQVIAAKGLARVSGRWPLEVSGPGGAAAEGYFLGRFEVSDRAARTGVVGHHRLAVARGL
jgi:hypothetical protein